MVVRVSSLLGRVVSGLEQPPARPQGKEKNTQGNCRYHISVPGDWQLEDRKAK
jgi:hypothetical protein